MASLQYRASLAASLVWGAAGVVLLGLAWERARRAIATQERALQVSQRRLDEEADEDEADEEPIRDDEPPPLPGAEGEPPA